MLTSMQSSPAALRGLTGKEPTCQRTRHGFHPWSRRIPWRRKGQPTSEFLPGKCHRQRSLEGYSPQGHNLAAEQQQHLDYQFRSVTQSCPTLCDPMDCSTPGLPVHHQLPEITQTHVYRVGDAIQPSHPLSPPSPPALNLSQHQDLFK